jgi:hypothetical protein
MMHRRVTSTSQQWWIPAYGQDELQPLWRTAGQVLLPGCTRTATSPAQQGSHAGAATKQGAPVTHPAPVPTGLTA